MLLTLVGLMGVLLMYVVSRVYRGEDGRIPPISTSDGKWARIISGGAIFGLITVCIFDTDPSLSSQQNLVLAIDAVIVAISLVWVSLRRNR
jgi:hypothetical protein